VAPAERFCNPVQVLAAAKLRVIALEEPVPVTVKLFNGPLITSVKKLPVEPIVKKAVLSNPSKRSEFRLVTLVVV